MYNLCCLRYHCVPTEIESETNGCDHDLPKRPDHRFRAHLDRQNHVSATDLPRWCPKTRARYYTHDLRSVRENQAIMKTARATSREFSDNHTMLEICLKTISPLFFRGFRAPNRGKFAKCCPKTPAAVGPGQKTIKLSVLGSPPNRFDP